MSSISKQIENKVLSYKPGTVFFLDSFYDIESTEEAIRKTLGRLVEDKRIVRVARGIYCYPKKDKWDGANLRPSIEDIAIAVADRDKVRIIPTGEYALNKLGLSTQVPANAVFITDGSSRKISIGSGKGILFKHTSEMRSFAYNSKLVQMIVFALKEIGKNNATDEQLGIIKNHLDQLPIDTYKEDLKLAPAWIRQIINTKNK